MATQTPGTNRLLASVQVTSLGAGQSLGSVSGATNTDGSGTVQMTANSVNTTRPLANTVWDVLYPVVSPGVLAAGQTQPDLKCWVVVDNVSYKNVFYFDITADGLVFPRRANAVGQKSLVLGLSLLADAGAKGSPLSPYAPKNAAVKYTGIKVSDDVEVWFYSKLGFASTVFAQPPTVALYGDILDETALQYVGQRLIFNSAIKLQSVRRALKNLPAYTAQFEVNGLWTLAGWKGMPNGPKQGATKVSRMVKTAFNNLAVSGNNYALSKIVSVGGTATNIVSADDDMGFAYTKTSNAVQLREFGRRPGAGAGYAGLFFGGSSYSPEDTATGMVSTAGDPRIPFGSVQPSRPESNLWFAPSAWGAQSPGEQAPEVVANETAAIAISPQNGSTIDATTDETLLGGVVVEGG